jgi:hypothetical protein
MPGKRGRLADYLNCDDSWEERVLQVMDRDYPGVLRIALHRAVDEHVVASQDSPLTEVEVRIVNPSPLPGDDGVLAPSGNTRAFITKNNEPDSRRVSIAFVPSFRLGMPYDLGSYPESWVTVLQPDDKTGTVEP